MAGDAALCGRGIVMAEGWKWEDETIMNESKPTRRVIGLHSLRWDGLADLILRARGASVFDVGCNRGHISIGVQHKLTRIMKPEALSALITDLGNRSITYLGWNGYDYDVAQMDAALAPAQLKRVHTSELVLPGRLAAIWKRGR
jgi:hypothetical protein